jgi:predicted transcriptional regulator
VAKFLGVEQAAVMSFVWGRGSATVREVVDARAGRAAYTTVMTMMVRLYERGFLARESERRAFRYRPTKTRDEFLSDLVGSQLDQLVADFGDTALTHIVQLVDHLAPDQVAALRRGTSDARRP